VSGIIRASVVKKPSVRLRKQPASDSAAEITNAILDAAEQVLARGIDGFTTNRVALEAGVSIGSLYQYFPNKDAILAEVARRLELRAEESIARALADSHTRPLEEVAALVVDTLLGARLGSAKMRHELRKIVPLEWTIATSATVDDNVRALLSEALARHPDVRSGDPRLLAWVVGHAVEHVVESAVASQPELLDSGEFREELIQLATRYLRRN
jgi:AcrR family transcriptional regulator